MQPASREQIVAIIRQRAERHREFAAGEVGIEARGLGPGPAPPPFMAPGLPHHPPIPVLCTCQKQLDKEYNSYRSAVLWLAD